MAWYDRSAALEADLNQYNSPNSLKIDQLTPVGILP